MPILIILGVVGLWFLSNAVRSVLERKFWAAAARGIVGAIFLSIVLVPLVMPIHTGHPPSGRSQCMCNLSQIGKAMKMYSMDHDEKFPSDFGSLWVYADNPRLYVCPASGREPGDMSNVFEWTDYVFVPNLEESDPANAVHAFCPPENHSGKGANVLLVDGSVSWVSADEFAKLTNNLKFTRLKRP